MLSKEQQAIVEDILMKKQQNPDEPLYLFLTGGAGTGKTFTTKAMYQGLLHLYNNAIDSHPDKVKGFLLAYTGKATYNIGGTTLHSALFIPFNKSTSNSLRSERLDVLTKEYQQLRLVLIDEISLIGARMLHCIDKRFREIMQTLTKHFGGLDIIFCGDLYQAEPIHDCLVFQAPTIDTDLLPYDFWQQLVKCFNLQTTMRQTDQLFVAALNRIRMGSQTKEDIAYLNSKCLRTPPVDPMFPFLFYKRKDVDAHNQNILSTLPGELLIINAIDEHNNTVPIEQLYKHSANLANQIILKEDILIEIYGGNYDI
ncbi:ATP-dependent DNA helicase PIF1-like [Cryptomeria japonica]|uniref:ATP-dependent DNA helicase PIF1-like n=1 Tax=Cryptomeria japonica TaxID=3369 RepID=UPI0027DA0BF8|nr:ATP-dependent DNA helicase PIF1-like [Cryptomeria japonica]